MRRDLPVRAAGTHDSGQTTKIPAGWMLKVEYPRHEQTTEILAQHE